MANGGDPVKVSSKLTGLAQPVGGFGAGLLRNAGKSSAECHPKAIRVAPNEKAGRVPGLS